ncbi:MAG: hypothetical protein NZ992_04090, partial [Candidatus Korarchaeum sp.]|nr:hypothetical protein [Candidatus Korarchaeum sp.]
MQRESDPVKVLRPELIIEKLPSSQRAYRGDTVSWTIKVKNVGLAPAENVTIVDKLGSGLTYSSASPYPPGTLPDGSYYWTGISLGVDEEYVINLNAVVSGCGDLTDEVEAYINCFGVECGHESASAGVLLTVRTPGIEVQGDLEPSPVTPCKPSRVTLRVRNDGDGTAYSVDLKVRLPPGIAYQEGTGSPAPEVSSRDMTFHLGDIEAGVEVLITFNVTSGCGTTGDLSLPVSFKYRDECGEPWVPPFTYLTIKAASPSVSISKRGPHEVLNISSFETYTMSVRSSGLEYCESPRIYIEERLPGALEFLSADLPPNSTSGGLLMWDLRAGDYDIDVRVRKSGSAECGDHGLNSASVELRCC